MNKEQVIALLKTGQVKIAFDTNALESDRKFASLCNYINRINDKFKYQLQAIVPALAYFEKLHHLKHQYKERFDLAGIFDGLKDKQVQIMPFEPNHAEAVATLLYSQFLTEEAWQTAKIERCAKWLGIPTDNTSKNKSCSATIDWLIAGYAVAESCLLITDDKGIEFKEISCKTNLEILGQGLCELLSDNRALKASSN
jgi:hypothetical protein